MALSVSVWPCTQPFSSLAPCGDVLCLGIMYPFPLKTPMSQSCASHASKHLLLITDLSTYWMWCFPPVLLPRLGWGGPSINSIHSGLQSISILTQTRKHHNSCVLLWAHPKAATGAPNIVTFLLFFFLLSPLLWDLVPGAKIRKGLIWSKAWGLSFSSLTWVYYIELSCITDLIPLEKKPLPGRGGDHLPGVPRYMWIQGKHSFGNN